MPFMGVLLGGVSALFIWGLVQQVVLGKTFGDQPMSDGGLLAATILVLVFTVGMLWLFWNSRVELVLDEEGLRVRFAPWSGERRVKWSELKAWRMGQYHPLWDFGGKGMHWTRKGLAFAVKGRDGLALEFTSTRKGSKQMLIGTQDPRGLREAMERMAPKGTFRPSMD